jgi:hypothetical protein
MMARTWSHSGNAEVGAYFVGSANGCKPSAKGGGLVVAAA